MFYHEFMTPFFLVSVPLPLAANIFQFKPQQKCHWFCIHYLGPQKTMFSQKSMFWINCVLKIQYYNNKTRKCVCTETLCNTFFKLVLKRVVCFFSRIGH